MPGNRSDTPSEEPCGLASREYGPDVAAAAVLSALLDENYQGPWTVADLKSSMGSDEEDVQRGLRELRGAGLIFMQGEIVFPRLAARKMGQLGCGL